MLGSLATNLVPSPHHSFGPLFLCGFYFGFRFHRTLGSRGYFFLIETEAALTPKKSALRLVNAASPRTISLDKKKISSGTQGIFTEALFEKGKVVFPKFLQSFMNVSSFQTCRLVKRNRCK